MRTLLFAFLVVSATIARADAPSRWLLIKSAHFTVITDAGERQGRHTAGQLERMHAVYAKLLPKASDDPGSQIVVLALRDRKDFQAVEPAAYLAKNALDLAGLFLRGDDRNYILLRLDSTGDHPYATVYHEYTHYMVRHVDFLPVWLNEGLAQFYQNTTIYDHEFQFGLPDANEILYLRQQRLMPLQTLFAVDHNSPYYHDEDKGSIFYGESWALTHYLTLQDFTQKTGRLRAYEEALAKGDDSLTAAREAFGDLRTLQGQLQSYIDHGDYQALRMPLQSAVDEKLFDVQPMPTPDADAVRADVLARVGRTREAETLATAVLAEAPQNPEACESMGWIRLREGEMEAARKFFAQAVALHSTSFLAYYYNGSLALRDGTAAPESAADSLREALKLNPHFAPAMESLAQFDAMHKEKLDEALTLSVEAVMADPGNVDYRLNAAEVRVTRNELPSAISSLQATAKLAHTPEERDRVQARLQSIERFQQEVEQAKTLQAEGSREMAAAANAPPPVGPATLKDRQGKVLHAVVLKEPDHKLPEGSPTGAKHTVTGTVHNVACFCPKGLTLRVEGVGAPVSLYSNDMYAVSYTTGNFTATHDMNPCTDFEGLKAKVTYGAVDDPTVAGQIVAMELNH